MGESARGGSPSGGAPAWAIPNLGIPSLGGPLTILGLGGVSFGFWICDLILGLGFLMDLGNSILKLVFLGFGMRRLSMW